MRALTPWTGLSTLKKEMDRLFHGFWEGDVPHLPSMGDRAHAMDVSETKDAVMVRAEVPGMEPKELQLSLQDQLLTLEGEKNQAKEGCTSTPVGPSGPMEPSGGRCGSRLRSTAHRSRPRSRNGRALHGDAAEVRHREGNDHSDQSRVGC